MSFMTINGTAFPVELNSLAESFEDVGDAGRAHGGAYHRTRQARKRLMSFNSIVMAEADARAWRGIIEGDGQCWNFEDPWTLFSKRGKAVASPVGLATSASIAKFGAKSCQITNTTGSGVFATGGDGTLGATYSFWEYTAGAPTWDNWVYRWNGASFDKYKNGVATGSSPLRCIFTPTVTQATLTSINDGFARFVDDVAALPFVVPVAWITGLMFPGTTAYPGTPNVLVAGDVVGSGVSLTMAGAVDTANYVMGNLSGSPASNLQRLAVKLLEV